MKATGIIRRIDELGRVVIPKELRRNFKIREGEPLEIFVDRNGEVILKKYSPIEELRDFAQKYADSLFEAAGHVVCITDRDMIIAVAGAPKNEFLNHTVSAAAEEVMTTRKSILINDTSKHEFYKDADEETSSIFHAEVIAPIINEGDPIGTVILGTMNKDLKMGDIEIKLAETAAGFIAKQIDF